MSDMIPTPVTETLYRDYIMLDGHKVTPDSARASFVILREQCMDLPIRVVPIVLESERAVNAQNLSENERYALDVAEYNLDDPTADGRIKNEFQYLEHMLRGIANNISVLLQRRRVIFRQASDIDIMSEHFYNELKNSRADTMGKSENARKMWFVQHYPALHEIRKLYNAMLDEMDIEKERLSTLSTSVSRSLSAVQDDYQARGMLGGIRIAGHNETGRQR